MGGWNDVNCMLTCFYVSPEILSFPFNYTEKRAFCKSLIQNLVALFLLQCLIWFCGMNIVLEIFSSSFWKVKCFRVTIPVTTNNSTS